MRTIKILSVFGTRPEGIKMCPLIKKIQSDNRFKSIVCNTAQHREMLDEVLEIFDVKAEYDLNLMQPNQTLVDISANVLKGVSHVIDDCKPDIVLVHGDTSTTFNSALAAFYKKVPVGHVEAGLRSYDIYSPFPEELNRKLTGNIATLHFAPTKTNKENLVKEQVNKERIFVTGNTVIDALLSVINLNIVFKQNILNDIDYDNKDIILLTTHRRENWGEPMKNIFLSIIKLLKENNKIEVIFPMHKNPMIRELAHKYFDDFNDRVHLIEPLEYVEFANLMSKVKLIMTDSGGIQEEAPTLGKPVLVLRTETERPEAVEAGTIKLVGIKTETIYKEAINLLNNSIEYNKMAKASNPYGDGNTCERILNHIYNYCSKHERT
ncbi:non-hydrolyzing UDP-N-acetylglucosamine 2-epimerase [Clostridium butyricum]|uniref:non-hydrolyzing UDP-N-acetylglucosamine 2-epimerase n=1 Tax=Clostridium butyricum TaxID=1492 RepID=UPI0009C1458F|nr:UDP-N-acetylglucosamine 2-epimerase (non-hydrolyzing) [Clostridium butyricum]MCI3009541.1 UDP-N-acetylglucosamine 2-epimerase (non-hydrolyzing) [Clostridium butyricum]MDM8132226.1 UDP-N-acetylglucosamine 2-epimerase (non-hydrolyzing) [Clostridium butyricum]MDM8230737.1 UDP-N-acetylglucosamine 2-epimerase (non-hydrolyzing) [Clostridium butyricum]MDP0841621.1 UDP-N-acetylglucosamine 2-epimerase (non-hydrolyzing) [Clostridium butyricum]NVO93439.1 UDP-N-acetylglucosamine 2-epimerase (non-hydrol